MASITFSKSYYIDYFGDINANVRLTFSEDYTWATNQTKLTLSKLEFQLVGNSAKYAALPIYGVIKVAGTTVATMDNSASGKIGRVTINGGSFCTADLSNVTITPVTVTHNTNGSKSVTVELSGGFTNGQTYFSAVYGQQLTSVFTNYVPIGVQTTTSDSMALTSHTRQWTVSYNKGADGTGTNTTDTKTYGTNLTLKGAIFTRTGYTQTGWSTTDGGSKVYNLSAAYSSNAAVTLYPYWTANTWTVSYNANGGTGAPSSQTKTYGKALTLSTTKPTKASASAGSYTVTYNYNGNGSADTTATAARTTAYTFSKWNTKADGSGADYSSGGSYTANEAVTLYAKWSASTTAAEVTLPTPTRTGYTFAGWYTAASGGSLVGAGGAKYRPSKNVTLYAHWTANEYTLSISAGTGSSVSVKRNGTELTNGAKIYYNDSLVITFSAASGFAINTHTVNESSFTSGGTHTVSGNVSVVATATAQASTILSISSSVETTKTLSIQMNRNSADYYHKATFKIGNTTLATSSAFGASLSYTVPRTWFNGYPNDTSKTVTVSVQTYTNSACTTAVGSPATTTFTVKADAGMKPSVSSGWATASAYNTGTAAANISGFVKGYSKAQITFNANKITMANNATIASYSITCLGSTVSSSPYRTPTLNATSVSVVCTVTDSRGRKASATLTISVMDYAYPNISGVSVYRCDSSGTADDDGTYYSVKATASVSSLNGENTLTLKGAIAAAGGSYGTAYSLTSGTRTIKGTILADTSYTVRIRATDGLGNTTTYYAPIPTRKWAMKFRPTGEGVAFGKTAEYDNALEIPADWDFRIGGERPFTITPSRLGVYGISVSGEQVNATIAQIFAAIPAYSRVVIPWLQGGNTTRFGTLAGELPGSDYGMFIMEKSSSVAHCRFIAFNSINTYIGNYSTVNSEGFSGWAFLANSSKICNALFNGGTSYADRETAANAVWNDMTAGTVRVGMVTINGTNYLYEAMKNSANYAVCTMTSYSGANIYRIVKTNGTVSSYTYTGTAS